ncbi:MAG: cobalamin B12-binding domain-containing protein [Rhodospirillales bacterium]|nr:cobalamin B12-binding domain-containing protein [Rhodospirillales bacterium]
MNANNSVKVGIMNIGGAAGGHLFVLPYLAGTFEAYVQEHTSQKGRFQFVDPVFLPQPESECVKPLAQCDIVGISMYNWNREHCLTVAKELKAIKPDIFIVLGGQEVPETNTEAFMREHPYIDVMVHGDGERAFLEILETYPSRQYQNIAGVSTILEHGGVFARGEFQRNKNLEDSPSPYSNGFMENLLNRNPDIAGQALIETNRGCPYSCTFCQWGDKKLSKVYQFPMDRVKKDLKWAAQNKQIDTIYVIDSNFGLFERDIEITEYVAEQKLRHGGPRRFFSTGTKNNGKIYKQCIDILFKADLITIANFPLQSLNEQSLQAIKRKNASFDYVIDQLKLKGDGVRPTYSDLILPLPEETYESFTDGYNNLLTSLRNGAVYLSPLQLLTNSALAQPDMREKYGFKTVKCRYSFPFMTEATALSQEGFAEVVVGTNTMPTEDWERSYLFASIIGLLIECRLLEIPAKALCALKGVSYKAIVEALISAAPDYPALAALKQLGMEVTNSILDGINVCAMEKHSKRCWHGQKYLLISLVGDGLLESFFEAANDVMQKSFVNGDQLLALAIKEGVDLSANLLCKPGLTEATTMQLETNILDVFDGFNKFRDVALELKNSELRIHSDKETWDDMNSWSEQVVMFRSWARNYQYHYEIDDFSMSVPIKQINLIAEQRIAG